MGLIHRMHIRTRGGGRPWLSARTMRSAGRAFDRPVGVAASTWGNVFIGDEGVPFVVEIDSRGEVVWRQGSMNSRGHPWFGDDGTAFFPTEGSVIEPSSSQRHTFEERRPNKQEPVTKVLAGARGIFGEWILVHDNGKRVSVFDRQARFVRSQMPAGNAQITDVEVDGQGNIYLLDRRSSRVVRFSSTGQALGFAAQGSWERAEALALDQLGNVYVLDRDAKRIDVFDAHGQRITQLGPDLPDGISLDDPRDLAVDGAGRLFIADRRLQAVVVLE
jgi:DNA-binding beta-propeller fold protein YncE